MFLFRSISHIFFFFHHNKQKVKEGSSEEEGVLAEGFFLFFSDVT